MAPLPNLIPVSGADLAPGAWRPIIRPAPGPGNGHFVRVESGILAVIAFASAALTTDAIVGNRVPQVTILDADSQVVWQARSPANVVASSGAQVSITQGIGQSSTGSAVSANLALPAFWLPAGYGIQLDALNLDGNDTFGALRGVLIELDPSHFYPAGGIDEWMPSHHRERRR